VTLPSRLLRTDLSFSRVKMKYRRVVSFTSRPADFSSCRNWTDRTQANSGPLDRLQHRVHLVLHLQNELKNATVPPPAVSASRSAVCVKPPSVVHSWGNLPSLHLLDLQWPAYLRPHSPRARKFAASDAGANYLGQCRWGCTTTAGVYFFCRHRNILFPFFTLSADAKRCWRQSYAASSGFPLRSYRD
jgi:hypothetical protein